MKRFRACRFAGGAVVLTTIAAALMLTSVAAGAQDSKPSAKANTAPAGDAKNGKRIYTTYGCYQCHGYEAQGSLTTGPRLAPRPIRFPAFVAYVRQPAGQMPPYTGKVVSESELADIYAFLETVPPPPPLKSIPLLNQ